MKTVLLCLAAVVSTAVSCTGVEFGDREARRRVLMESTTTEREEVARVVRRGGRPGGAGDCRAVLRKDMWTPQPATPDVFCVDQRSLQRIDWVPTTITLTDDRVVPIERSSVSVPERRGSAGSRQLDLELMRLPGRVPSGQPPLLFLDGAPDTGPTSRSLRLPELMAFFELLSENRDVVFMDYRGTGRSGAIECPPHEEIPVNTFESREAALPYFVEQARRCAETLRQSGVDLSGYTWREVAADADDVRRALGVEEVDLLGFSSGTHAALVTAREHPGAIRRMVLIGTEGPDHTRKLPLNGDRQLEKVSAAIVSAGGRPGFAELVSGVLERAETEPFLVSLTTVRGDRLEMRVGRYALAYLATRNMSSPREIELVIPLFTTLAAGDVSILSRALQQLAGSPSVLNAPTYLMDGAAGISPQRAERLREEAGRSIFADAASFPYPEIEGAWGYDTLEEAYRLPVRTGIHTLFITGELDGNTPPEQAADIARGFSRSTELVVANAGHAEPMRMPAVARTIADFLDGKEVSGTALAAEPMRISGR